MQGYHPAHPAATIQNARPLRRQLYMREEFTYMHGFPTNMQDAGTRTEFPPKARASGCYVVTGRCDGVMSGSVTSVVVTRCIELIGFDEPCLVYACL